MGVVHALPLDWKTTIRTSVSKSKKRPSPHTSYLKLTCGSFSISDVTSKQIYDSVLCKKANSSSSPAKINTQILSLLSSVPCYTYSKLKEFQCKIFSNIVFTNDTLFRFGLSHSPNCTATVCNEEPESLGHSLVAKYLRNFGKKSCLGLLRIITSL